MSLYYWGLKLNIFAQMLGAMLVGAGVIIMALNLAPVVTDVAYLAILIGYLCLMFWSIRTRQTPLALMWFAILGVHGAQWYF